MQYKVDNDNHLHILESAQLNRWEQKDVAAMHSDLTPVRVWKGGLGDHGLIQQAEEVEVY